MTNMLSGMMNLWLKMKFGRISTLQDHLRCRKNISKESFTQKTHKTRFCARLNFNGNANWMRLKGDVICKTSFILFALFLTMHMWSSNLKVLTLLIIWTFLKYSILGQNLNLRILSDNDDECWREIPRICEAKTKVCSWNIFFFSSKISLTIITSTNTPHALHQLFVLYFFSFSLKKKKSIPRNFKSCDVKLWKNSLFSLIRLKNHHESGRLDVEGDLEPAPGW